MKNIKTAIRTKLRNLYAADLGSISAKVDAIYAEMLAKNQSQVAAAQNPFWHYQCAFDAVGTMQKFSAGAQEPTPGFLTNYLGVKIDPQFLPHLLVGRENTVELMPQPNNWHADIAEFAAALRAVDLAGGHFAVAELGCGWGCWLNITGAAARRSGRSVRMIGIEGDVGHAEFARQSLTTNGFAKSDFDIITGIAGSEDGTALFPRQAKSGIDWGLAPELKASAERIAAAVKAGTHEALPVVSLATLTARHGPLDLPHVDIQGGEADLLEASIDVLNASVRYVVVGTHSRVIEGRLEALMFANGWTLEMDRPAISSLEDGVQTLRVDGVQGWRNSRPRQ